MDQRPRTVPIVAGFLYFASAIAAIVGVSLLFPNRLLDRLWEFNKPGAIVFRALGRIAGVPLLALSVATFTAARGLLQRRKWAWWFAVVLFAVEATSNVSLFLAGDVLRSLTGFVISAAFLYFLIRRPVRRYFVRPA